MINNRLFQDYFLRRMAEMMHKDTLDSYRVRVNNVLSIMIELSNVLNGWIKGNVKHFITVEYCIQECLDLLDSDDCLTFQDYSKKLLINLLAEYKGNNNNKEDHPNIDSTYSLKYTLDSIVKTNQKEYFSTLLSHIKEFMFINEEFNDDKFTEKFRQLGNLLSAFGTELIRIGYSKKFLYLYFLSMKDKILKSSFDDIFEKMYEFFNSHITMKYEVIIKLSFINHQYASLANENIEEIVESIPDDLKNQIHKHLSYKRTNSQTRYYIYETMALDSTAAARIGYENLSELLDTNQDILKYVIIPNHALVLVEEEGSYSKETTESFYILDTGGKFAPKSVEPLNKVLSQIKSSKQVKQDVKDRIESALRHLRIGDYQIEIEQQFINYWIALEFIFSTGDRNSSTFERIKTYLVNILSVCYMHRNEQYLRNWLLGEKLITTDDSYLDKIKDNEFINSLTSTLDKFRSTNFKSHAHHKDKIKVYIEAHKKHLLQHISRIYRLRNELVHEAAIKQDIANVTSNLRFYLTFILNQLLGFCLEEISNDNDISMRKFFWNYEKWAKYIKEVDAVDGVLQVPIAKNYIL